MEPASPPRPVELTSRETPPQTETRPPLSVVLASTQPWPEGRRCLDALVPQARALGAELIVVDGDGRSVPPGAYSDVDLRVVPLLGASPYQLRAAGLQAARGEIVAGTEDHCVVPPDWCGCSERRGPRAPIERATAVPGRCERRGVWGAISGPPMS